MSTYDYGVMPGSGANREDLRGGKKRAMPSAKAAARAPAAIVAPSPPDMHMTIAANKTRARFAAGQAESEAGNHVKNFFSNINPFAKITKALGGN